MSTSARELFEKFKDNTISLEEANAANPTQNRQYTTQYQGILPPEQINVGHKDTKASSLDEFVEGNVTIPENYYPPIFKDLGYISKNPNEKTDFSDLEYKDSPAIKLFELEDEEICILGKSVFSDLTSGISRATTAAILVLAFQLKKQGYINMGRVFPPEIPEVFDQTADIGYADLDTAKISYVGPAIEIKESSDRSAYAKAYPFLAASMLRMFTRSPENFEKAWTHICEGYRTFYSCAFPLGDLKPHLEILKDVHRQFSIDFTLKATLFRILYLSNESEDNKSLKKFLYDLHLSHTGMHILPITIKLCDTLHCNASLLLVFLWKGEYDRQIESLSKLLTWIIKSPEGKERAMWRYGRIFSQNFMSSLQTRACPKLVYILAAALKQERPNEHEHILDIAQLREVSASDRKKCSAGGKYLVKLVRENVNKDHL